MKDGVDRKFVGGKKSWGADDTTSETYRRNLCILLLSS